MKREGEENKERHG